MKLLQKNGLSKAILLAITTSMLAACGADSDSSDGEAGVSGLPGTSGEQGITGLNGIEGAIGANGSDGQDATTTGNPIEGLTRMATVPTGAEVTGIFLTPEGDLFFNAQHPADSNIETDGNAVAYNTGTVGVIEGINFNNLPNALINLPVPKSDYERQTVQTAYGQYKVLGQSASTLGGKLEEGLGTIYNLAGDTKIFENNMPDFNGFIPTGPGKGYLFTNWELFPGGMSRMNIEKDAQGNWGVLDAMMVDFASVNGTGANCFGSVSPWNTPLTSEEWVVNTSVGSTTNPSWNSPTKIADDALLAGMWALSDNASNPYDYGYIVEITDPESVTPLPVKHFTIGRYEHENSIVMPDRKTVYSSQDDTGGVLFKFVADTAEDLTVGTLFGAKLEQDAGLNDPAVTGFDVTWVELASGNNAEIGGWINEFDGIGTDQFVDGESSYMTLADVEAWADWVIAGRQAGVNYPTLANGGGKVTAGLPMDDRSAFLESRQAARQLGATAEWRKLEGISIHQDRVEEAVTSVDKVADEVVTAAYMYLAIADLDNTMIDDEGDIQLSSRVKDCGGVYRAKIENDYSLTRIEPVIMGATYRSSLDGAERCDVNNLSQPDNVVVMKDGRILLGEDGFQENNTLWMYDPR
ncbi:MAG: secreted PhoX family phosphatase [Oleispira sp.]|jgi:secreted PhoX family phosphatase